MVTRYDSQQVLKALLLMARCVITVDGTLLPVIATCAPQPPPPQDVLVTPGGTSTAAHPVLFCNNGDGTFTDCTSGSGLDATGDALTNAALFVRVPLDSKVWRWGGVTVLQQALLATQPMLS